MRKLHQIIMLLVLVTSISACKKEWNQGVAPDYLEKGSLYDHLSSDPDLTQFMNLARKAGYDSVMRHQAPYTILAVKNGGFVGLDTNNLVYVKKLIGMHIISSAIYQERMIDLRVPSMTGKYVKFLNLSGTITANNIVVTGTGDRVANGVSYKLQTAIIPLPTLYDIISTDPNYSLYLKYIQSTYASTFDPVNNIITKYDSLGKPVYKVPIKYIQSSPFISYAKIDSEKVYQTVFIPTNAVVTKVFALMLSARGGDPNLVIPAIGSTHPETNVGGYYFPVNTPYAGDSTIVQNYLFRNTIVDGIISKLTAGINTFKNKDGNVFTVESSQISSEGFASNGKYYVLNDVTLPGSSYRKTFMFDPRVDLVVSPLIASAGAKNTITTQNAGTTSERASDINFNNVGGKIDITFPNVTSGKYKAVMRYIPVINTAVVNVSYNGLTLLQNFDSSYLYTLALPNNQPFSTDAPLGQITVAADGPVKLSFICAAPATNQQASYFLRLNTIRLIPID